MNPLAQCSVCLTRPDIRPVYHVCPLCGRGRCAGCYADSACLCVWNRFVATHPAWPRQTLTEWAWRGWAMPLSEPQAAR